MSISRFRHTQSVPARLDKQFLNVSPTGAIWDCSNMIACNDRFVAVPWAQLGSTAVLRHKDYGKVASNPPILTGQEGPIIDVAFNPFDSTKLFTASEDGSIMGWNIPEEGLTQSSSENIVHLQGHSKKVGIMSFHPSASNVLASAGADMVVNLWDVDVGKVGSALKCHTDQIMALDWNLDGSLLCSTSKNKRVNIMDPRQGDIVALGSAHQGGKTQRCVWAKRLNLIITTGFGKSQGRQVMLWDTRNMASPLQTEEFDQTSSVMLPFFDEDTNILYVGSKGDGGIRFFELMEGKLFSCAAYTSREVHKGLCIFPKWSLDTRQCEIARFYALTPRSIYSIQMFLPRRMAESELQTDVYPPTFADKPALTAGAYFKGESSEPLVIDMRAVFNGTEREAKRVSELSPLRIRHIDGTSSRSRLTESTPTEARLLSATPVGTRLFDGATPFNLTDSVMRNGHFATTKEDIKPMEKAITQLELLVSELEKQQEDVNRCRAELGEKERCVMDTISKIRAIASGHSK